MTEFIQVHALVSYPPSNLNRGEDGSPKTARVGGTLRGRISSQSLKHAYRKSEIYREYLKDLRISVRSRHFGVYFNEALITGNQLLDCINGVESQKKNRPVDVKIADMVTKNLVLFIGSKKDKTKDDEVDIKSSKKGKQKVQKNTDTEINEEDLTPKDIKNVPSTYMTKEICVLSPSEIINIGNCIHLISEGDEKACELLAKQEEKDEKPLRNKVQKAYNILSKENIAADIAMCGRMSTSHPALSIDAAMQLAHAITVNSLVIEDDYFSAVDDLNKDDDSGSAHLNVCEFSSGVYYIYANINKNLLKANLGGDIISVENVLKGIIASIFTVSPSGKQNSFASRAYVSYALVTKGTQAFGLHEAFLDAINARDLLGSAITALQTQFNQFEKLYGKFYTDKREMNIRDGNVSMKDIQDFVVSDIS